MIRIDKNFPILLLWLAKVVPERCQRPRVIRIHEVEEWVLFVYVLANVVPAPGLPRDGDQEWSRSIRWRSGWALAKRIRALPPPAPPLSKNYTFTRRAWRCIVSGWHWHYICITGVSYPSSPSYITDCWDKKATRTNKQSNVRNERFNKHSYVMYGTIHFNVIPKAGSPLFWAPYGVYGGWGRLGRRGSLLF